MLQVVSPGRSRRTFAMSRQHISIALAKHEILPRQAVNLSAVVRTSDVYQCLLQGASESQQRRSTWRHFLSQQPLPQTHDLLALAKTSTILALLFTEHQQQSMIYSEQQY